MTVTASPRSGLPAFIRRIHFYAGLFVAPLIFFAALNGALYAVAPTLENVVYLDVLTVEAQPGEVSLPTQIQAARAMHPDMEVAQVWPSSEATEPTRVLLIDESIAAQDELRSVFVNPHTGQVIGDEPSYSGVGELPLRHWISALHKDLHLGAPGELYSELAASWLWVVALGGLFLWARIARERVLTGLDMTDGRRKRVVSLRGVAGTWLLVGMLALSATGITWSLFGGANVDRTAERLGAKAEPIETSLTGEETSDAGHAGNAVLGPEELADQAATVLATARAEGLTGQMRLFVPEDTAHAWQVSERCLPSPSASARWWPWATSCGGAAARPKAVWPACPAART